MNKTPAGVPANGNPLIAKGNGLVEGSVRVAGFDLVGIQMTAWSPGQTRLQMRVDARHHNPMGTVHGGHLAALADTAMGMATISILTPDQSFTTLSLETRFLRAVVDDVVVAEGRVVKPGRRIVAVEAELTDSKGRTVARSTATCMRLDAAGGGNGGA